MASEQTQVDQAVAQGGAYEVIRQRLTHQANNLKQQLDQHNQQRIAEFGQTKLEVLGRVRVRTENNCIARDIVPVGDSILFGYNVFIGLKKETQICDVFGLYRLTKTDSGFELNPREIVLTFLADTTFQKEFNELYVYYKEARLLQLKVQAQTLFAVFQIGRKLEDTRVFQWRLNKDGTASYIDNRGERALKQAASHDFSWLKAAREQHVSGQHPHVNVLDLAFVETIGGTLTIKVENNTEDGLGIYNEPVEDRTQSLADADIQYAQVGSLILFKILPYREKTYRYLVFNTRTNQIERIDPIGLACVSLPEDHGIIFPGGYYLQNGETKSFPDEIEGLKFRRSVRSPNGEDVLFIFHEVESGLSGLYSYNLIRKELQNPIYAHGYSLFDDGTMVVFQAENEATRVHPMQIWQTPYFSTEFAAKQPTTDSIYGRIGNKELVRGIAELTAVHRYIVNPNPNRQVYEDLIKTCRVLFDSYYWLSENDFSELGEVVKDITNTAELVIDEFEKVLQIRQQTNNALSKAEQKQQEVINSIRVSDWHTPEQYVACLTALRQQRGHLISLKEQRYIDKERLDQLDKEVSEHFEQLSHTTVEFLASDKALQPYHDQISTLENSIAQVELVVDIKPINLALDTLSAGLDLLTDILNGLKVDDATVRTQILDDISELYAKLNQVKAQGKQRLKQLGSGEASAEFAAQFRLFSQSISSALAMADSPTKADEQLSRLSIQLEELESKFSEYDQFLSDIMDKREELHSAFASRKQGLIEEQQRRAQNLFSAAQRIITGVKKRALSFNQLDELNTYFASDPMILKLSDLVAQLRELNDQVKADDLEAQLKAAKEAGIRGQRDKQDIFEDGGTVIKLGKHKFSVNSQDLELTLLPKDDGLYRHLIGTDFFEPLEHPQLNELKPYWQQALVSENKQVSRIEYLAFSIIQDAEQQRNDLTLRQLYAMVNQANELEKLVRRYMTSRYQEGYQKGVHDHDVVKILQALLNVHEQADLLRFDPQSRAIAMLFWCYGGISQAQQQIWQSHAFSAQLLANAFNSQQGFAQLQQNLESHIAAFVQRFSLPFAQGEIRQSAHYLSAELALAKFAFISSQSAIVLHQEFISALENLGHTRDFNTAMSQFNQQIEKAEVTQDSGLALNVLGLKEQWSLCQAWLSAMLTTSNLSQAQHYWPEAAALIICQHKIENRTSKVDLDVAVSGLLSEHHNIQNGLLSLSLDEFIQRLGHYQQVEVNGFKQYHQIRQQVMSSSKHELQLERFKAKPLSSFVRNRLINEVYLPIIGDNLAKQMGALGDNKRTDLMGLLLLISPPGYGKTTLMEYVADRLGLVFMKINCPSLGHDVMSLDPANAPNATAKQELEKLNLGLEMGSNVMLYLDDIQHTHPEFLQKFIALCDGTRRIEGVWKGQSKTYDMRGKKFSVVMAGNPYTESGDVFKVPDMLANRADIYNLGDVLGGKEEQFSLSYIENALTSNAVLSPLALRDMEDVYKFIAMAQGEQVATNELSHVYSGAEINEIVCVLKHLLVIQHVILSVNLEYIKSAATAEDYRQEPPFKLQGSYRNMNKMAEKVSAVMNHAELMQLIADHYSGEAQTLTSGAEENLLKLAILRGVITATQQQRWQHICSAFRGKKQLNVEGEPTIQAARQLGHIAASLDAIKLDMQQSDTSDLIKPINRVATAMQLLSKVWMGNDVKQGKNE
jgi:hypothetical protein